MKDETLLDRAVSNYKYAVKNYKFSSGDEVELNFIGYSLQQASELCIKHHMEINGVRYAKTHVIEDLLDECELQNIPITFSQEFYCFSPAITKWESKTRYIKNYVVTKRQIENGFRLIKEFLLSNGVNSGALELSKALTDKMNCF